MNIIIRIIVINIGITEEIPLGDIERGIGKGTIIL